MTPIDRAMQAAQMTLDQRERQFRRTERMWTLGTWGLILLGSLAFSVILGSLIRAGHGDCCACPVKKADSQRATV